jgi:hypothetical protein
MRAFKTRSRRAASDTCLGADENPPILKMAEREDWPLFRSIEGLCQKAGVRPSWLRRLVLKELADNALDTGAHIGCGLIDAEKSLDLFFIEDDGPGLDGTPEEIASLFSIRRPMRSSKLLRLPQRGALGNGLRVVAGAVLASAGSLVVITHNKRIKLRPRADGSTTVIGVTAAKRQRGTRITPPNASQARAQATVPACSTPQTPRLARRWAAQKTAARWRRWLDPRQGGRRALPAWPEPPRRAGGVAPVGLCAALGPAPGRRHPRP